MPLFLNIRLPQFGIPLLFCKILLWIRKAAWFNSENSIKHLLTCRLQRHCTGRSAEDQNSIAAGGSHVLDVSERENLQKWWHLLVKWTRWKVVKMHCAQYLEFTGRWCYCWQQHDGRFWESQNAARIQARYPHFNLKMYIHIRAHAGGREKVPLCTTGRLNS